MRGVALTADQVHGVHELDLATVDPQPRILPRRTDQTGDGGLPPAVPGQEVVDRGGVRGAGVAQPEAVRRRTAGPAGGTR
ncbi:hypothetical protein [Streptomyces enissocaesilis]|uniref:Uncharacterized protein n=1 Tax=Streptomyces enissocaesilis TaxID=332589 RepID=A0ABP6JNQ8_9ACTN